MNKKWYKLNKSYELINQYEDWEGFNLLNTIKTDKLDLSYEYKFSSVHKMVTPRRKRAYK